MDSATESLLIMPRIHVVGQLSVRALNSLPYPLVVVLFFACLTLLFRWPTSVRPILPVDRSTRLVPLPSSPRGEYVYLDKPSRQLVVSSTPLIPPRPPKTKKARPNQLKRLLSMYRPLGPVPEAVEHDLDAAVDLFGPESPV